MSSMFCLLFHVLFITGLTVWGYCLLAEILQIHQFYQQWHWILMFDLDFCLPLYDIPWCATEINWFWCWQRTQTSIKVSPRMTMHSTQGNNSVLSFRVVRDLAIIKLYSIRLQLDFIQASSLLWALGGMVGMLTSLCLFQPLLNYFFLNQKRRRDIWIPSVLQIYTSCIPYTSSINMEVPYFSKEMLNLQQFGMTDLPQSLPYNRQNRKR